MGHDPSNGPTISKHSWANLIHKLTYCIRNWSLIHTSISCCETTEQVWHFSYICWEKLMDLQLSCCRSSQVTSKLHAEFFLLIREVFNVAWLMTWPRLLSFVASIFSRLCFWFCIILFLFLKENFIIN